MDYTGGYSTFSLARFGQRFVDQVANPKNLLLWYRKKAGTGLGEYILLCIYSMTSYGTGLGEYILLCIYSITSYGTGLGEYI